MMLVWKVLMKNEAPGLSILEKRTWEVNDVNEQSGTENRRLTGSNFAELSGREEMTENRLKTGQNRFLLHRSYTEGRQDEGCWAGGLC
jgi:hypothetical protein